MDDYNITSITESKNEWCARLTNILTPTLIEGIKSIFEEAYKLCLENDEDEKYLMTFQNLLNNIPKWSSEVVNNEKNRILLSTGCNYLEDLLSCVYITQLKALTVTRVGLKQKKINIDIPDINQFIHKTYINLARKIYVNVYLFEKDIQPLQIQKHNRELEIIVKECILNTIRDSIPLENILKIYLDETQETDVEIEEHKEVIPDKEEIERQNKQQKEEELRKIREELKKEEKENQKIKMENVIKDITVSKEIKSKKEDEEKDKEQDKELDNEQYDKINKSESKNEIDLDKEFSEVLQEKADIESDIKQLDEDPDKLNLETIEIDNLNLDDENSIELDIEEL
tara:strand:- start:355 stop:1380 length:1026 start_codon:yes stop_codon:yes gene_type:complete